MLVNAAQLRLRTLEQQLNGDEESEGLPSPQHSPLPSPRLEHLRHPQMVDQKALTLKEAPSSGLPSPHASPPSSWHAHSDTASLGLPSPVPSPRLFDAEIVASNPSDLKVRNQAVTCAVCSTVTMLKIINLGAVPTLTRCSCCFVALKICTQRLPASSQDLTDDIVPLTAVEYSLLIERGERSRKNVCGIEMDTAPLIHSLPPATVTPPITDLLLAHVDLARALCSGSFGRKEKNHTCPRGGPDERHCRGIEGRVVATIHVVGVLSQCLASFACQQHCHSLFRVRSSVIAAMFI